MWKKVLAEPYEIGYTVILKFQTEIENGVEFSFSHLW